MRVLIVAAMLSFAGVLRARAQAAPLGSERVDSATRAQLNEARDAVWRSWFAADTASLSRLLPDAVAAGSPNGWQTRDSTVAESRRFASAGGRLVELRFDSTSIRLRGTVAVVQSRYHLVLDQRGTRTTQTGIATELFVRDRGRWVNPFWYLE